MSRIRNDLELEAVKYSCREDEDGEIKLTFRVSKQYKLSAIAIPAGKPLKLAVKVLKAETYGKKEQGRKAVKKGYDRLKAVGEAIEPGIDG